MISTARSVAASHAVAAASGCTSRSRKRAPIAIAIDYYGPKGWDDSFLDLFIASNGLYGDQINLLPAGFEVVIYA